MHRPERTGEAVKNSILSRILESFKSMFDLNKDFVAVEMGENFIKIAEVGLSKGVRIVKLLVKETIDKKDDALFADEIKAVFEKLHISRRNVMINIPRHLVTVRFLMLPSTDDAEILKMSRIESLKHVPYADEDMVSGCRVIEKLPDGYSNVLIAVAQAMTVKKDVDLLKKAGVSVDFAALGSESLFLWYCANRELKDDSTILLANIDAGYIDINIISAEKLVFTRGVFYSIDKPISSEKIVEQIHLSMAAYRKESGRSIDGIGLTGILDKANELKPVLSERVKIPVDIMSPAKEAVSSSPEGGQASYIELLGLALKPEAANINLLPQAIREDRRVELIKKNVMVGLTVSILIVMTVFGIILKKLHDKNAYISYVNSELVKIEPQIKSAKKMAKIIDLVTSKVAERPLSIDLVSEIFKITPSGIALSTMEYEKGKTITLRGTAANLSDIFKYVTILEKSAYFENVKVKYANKRVGQAADVADFEITCPISKVK